MAAIALGSMKTNPMIAPATAIETMEMVNKLIMLDTVFSKQFRYPTSLAKMSKTTLATVKAKKCVATGLSERVKNVAMTPVMVTAPNFLAHHKARINAAVPIISHRNGMWVSFQKIGARVMLSTAHKEAHILTAATSRASK